MKVIAEYISGSHLYKLNNENSDLDKRGIFLNTGISEIIGFNRKDSYVSQNDIEDIQYWELRQFLMLCKKSVSNALECLLYDHKDIELQEHEVRSNVQFINLLDKYKWELFNSKSYYHHLVGDGIKGGYVESELRAATGVKTGKLGEKRKMDLAKYGFSPKNMAHVYRLLFTGIEFFKNDVFKPSLNENNRAKVAAIKNSPENFSLENLIKDIAYLKNDLNNYYHQRHIEYFFNDDLANEIITKMYGPIVLKEFIKVNMV